jgi:hypothetical protein
MIGAAVVLLAGAGVGGAAVGARLGTEGPTASSAEAAPAGPTPDPGAPAGFVTVADEAAGFSVAYPAGWTRLLSPDPQVRLVAQSGPASVLVRVTPLATPIGPAQLPAAKELTDRLVLGNGSVHLLAGPHAIRVGGLPGYFYFYTFTDPSSGQTGAHSHFLLFHGNQMISLVFQAVPTDAFKPAAHIFDQITDSVRAW